MAYEDISVAGFRHEMNKEKLEHFQAATDITVKEMKRYRTLTKLSVLLIGTAAAVIMWTVLPAFSGKVFDGLDYLVICLNSAVAGSQIAFLKHTAKLNANNVGLLRQFKNERDAIKREIEEYEQEQRRNVA